ncbi:MAG TPA: TatD family hydrolase [Rubricoccaceae bacterium]|nr:TatD family hydrolase [Rubricoccaceae bacterium]
MLVDTHCHLYHARFDEDRDAVVERARAAGVERILLPAIDVASIHAALALCARHEGVYPMVAIHPSETAHATEADYETVVALCDDPRVVAVGETGLDYYWDRSFDDRQHDLLRRHARLAMEKDLPLVLHNRDKQGATESSGDLLRLLREERDASSRGDRLRGVFHCFGGTPAFAQAVLDLGFHVGIGGTLTYKNSGVADAIAGVSLDRIVLETDAPFLAPAPFRGKRNEPAHVRLVAEAMAAVRGLSFEEVAQTTTANAVRLFGLPA